MIDEEIDNDEAELRRGSSKKTMRKQGHRPLMYVTNIANVVAPTLDKLFPPNSSICIIAKPGQYLVVADCILVMLVISAQENGFNEKFMPFQISNTEAAMNVDQMIHAKEDDIIEEQGNTEEHYHVMTSIMDDIAYNSKLFAQIILSQQEVDVYTYRLDMTCEDPSALLSPPQEHGDELFPHPYGKRDDNGNHFGMSS